MPAEVKILAGPARSGKTRVLLSRYRKVLATSQIGGCCWIVPNNAAVSQLRDALASTKDNVYIQPNLLTFSSFAESLITRGRRRVRPISQLQKRRLLHQVIQSAQRQKKLDHFTSVASTPGFVIQLDEFIADLKRADVWPDKFRQWCEKRPRSDRRSRELGYLYTCYQDEMLRAELYDAEGRFWVAREILAEAATEDRHRYELVVVSGFNDFTTAQYDILQLLHERSSAMLFSLTLGAESNFHNEASELLFAKPRRTLSILQKVLPGAVIEHVSRASAADHSLAELQQQIFRESGTRTESTIANVQILAANSDRGEIEIIAQQIKTLLRQKGAKPNEIVLVHRGGENSATVIDAVFADFGLPYWSELQPRMQAEPIVRSLVTLLRLHRDDWPFQTLLEVVGNRLFRSFDRHDEEPTSFATRPRVAIEHCLRSAQLPAGKRALLEQLEYRQSLGAQDGGRPADERARQVSIALAELRHLDQLLSTLPEQGTVSEWITSLDGLLHEVGSLASGSATNSRATATWDLLKRHLKEVGMVDGWTSPDVQSISLDQLLELLTTIAREQRMPPEYDAVGRVRVLSAESARKLSTKHLFLAGLSEQAFSSATPNEQTFAADESTANVGMSESIPDELINQVESSSPRSDAMLLFYELATRPTESLTLSYPALDAKGQPLPPSPLLTDLERSVGEGRIARHTMALGQAFDHGAVPRSIGEFRRLAVDQALEGKHSWLAGLVSERNISKTGLAVVAGIECVAQRGVRERFGPHEGLLLSETAKETLARRFDKEHLWSPSQLEGYAACPFRFFSEQLLGLQPLNELTLSNDPRRRGSLLHQVLAKIHEELSREISKGKYKDLSDVDLVERFVSTLDSVVKASPLRGIEQSLREIERREIEAWAPDYAAQETSYQNQWKHLDEPPRPAHFEVRFGPETRASAADGSDEASTPLPFQLDLGGEQILLTGQIDRVDIGRVGDVTFFNIIDYKSGKGVKLNLDKIREGYQLQLPLYALAAEQLLFSEQQAVALAAGYWNIKTSGFGSKKGGAFQLRELADQSLVSSQQWQQLQPEVMTRVQQIVQSIRDGQFPVYNQDEHCTSSCSLNTICRVAQIRSLEKVWPATNDETPNDE